MKPLLNTTLLFLLVIGFSGGVSGQDFEETKRLAEQGNASAQYNLGNMYDLGEGVPENNAEAAKWYRLSAGQGYIIAQVALAVLYLINEEGDPQNNIRAYMWFSVAAGRDSATLVNLVTAAGDSRDMLAEILTPDQLARGQDMATRCFESDFQDCE